MDFFFPDSQDQVDPLYDFIEEEHPAFHVRQRDDIYAHEALTDLRISGILVSKVIVDGLGGKSGRYTMAQRHRLYRIGAKRFFRLGEEMQALGDCGAFSYVEDDEPPITPDDAIDFYEGCQFDAGISVDHVVTAFKSEAQGSLLDDVDPDWKSRHQITLENAQTFLARHEARGCSFEPVGAAQGWSPSSYADAVTQLQKMGYERIALGGMVPLKTPQIFEVLQAVDEVRTPHTRLHLLGVTRTEHVHEFAEHGVTSFDSTSPFRQSFMDDTNNYHWHDDEHYTAIRVPGVGANAKLKRRIKAGQVDQDEALRLEKICLRQLRAFDAGENVDLKELLDHLREYHLLYDGRDRTDVYRRTLKESPWKRCDCGICEEDGIEVAIFRGTERNKRRGFHNLAVFIDDLRSRLARGPEDSERTST